MKMFVVEIVIHPANGPDSGEPVVALPARLMDADLKMHSLDRSAGMVQRVQYRYLKLIKTFAFGATQVSHHLELVKPGHFLMVRLVMSGTGSRQLMPAVTLMAEYYYQVQQ